MEQGIILGIVGIAVLVIGFIVLAVILDQKRTQAFELAAGRLGFRFDPKAADVQPFLSGLHLFQKGRARRARRLLIGGGDEELLYVFDYRYTTGSGKHSSTHNQTVALFSSPPAALPEFQLRPEYIFDKIGAAFGYQDIDFPEHPEFSSKYLLRGPDEDALRRLFDSTLIEVLMLRKPICVETGASVLVLYRAHRCIAPGALADFIDEVRAIRSALLSERGRGVRYKLT